MCTFRIAINPHFSAIEISFGQSRPPMSLTLKSFVFVRADHKIYFTAFKRPAGALPSQCIEIIDAAKML